MLDDTLLDDPARLSEADGPGLLRASAAAGAQVRSVVEAAEEAGIAQFAADRPRALVLVARPGAGLAAAQLLMALLTSTCPVPVVLTDLVPSWVGALDVVIAHTEDHGDGLLAESVDRASRRGARVIVTAPAEGPVAAAAAGHSLLLPPRVPVPTGFGYARALAAGLVVVRSLGLLRIDLPLLADELDREAERDHLVHESFMNPAKSLALRLADRQPLLWGLDDTSTAVARHAAFALASHAGQVCDVAGYPLALSRPALHRAAVRSCSGGDLFADPDEDQAAQARVMLLAVATGPAAEAARRAAEDTLPGADVLVPTEEISGGEAVCAAVIALRFELAALYLGLAAGTIGGPGYYAPAAV
ncbi:hypothetical protein GCM10010174_11340 [Kutzneria viridogrisea]|uniref:Uncharacterized protein n=2 Tax=Kutzneria TaxID=43356 RepID=W5WK79_9PSEU|nr:SIS domain-containing protein [Kutzneria albida]AHI01263.1 hypothetical protein KALB_7905 [Kutzneria albida DSM 43870]MBA8926516.1 hypothetical protein [Kutzneria viridogrisea]